MDQLSASTPGQYIGNLVKEGFYDKLVIIGYPYDEGARKSGAKSGQDLGPDSFRRFLVEIGSIVNPEFDFLDISKGLPQISDYGNIQIVPKASQKDLLDKLQSKVNACINRQNIPFVVGGTRELSYAVSSAVFSNSKKSLMIFIRPEIVIDLSDTTSIITQKNSLNHIISKQQNNKILILTPSKAEIEMKDIELIDLQQLRNSGKTPQTKNLMEARTQVGIYLQQVLENAEQDDDIDKVFVSISLESIQTLPGVSTKCQFGIEAEEAVEICKVSGYKSKKLVAIDVSDYNPFIEDQNTGRLLATMFYYFALGMSARLQNYQ